MDPPSGAVRTLVLICRVSDAVTAASAVVSGPCLSSWTLDVRGPEARVTLKKVVSASGLPVFSTRLIWAIDVGDAVPGGPDAVPLGDLSVTSVGQADHEWREVSETWSIPPPFFTPFRAGKVLTRGFSLRCFVVVRGARIVPLPTLRAPRLSLPSKALTNESARETFGAVGITNQGATCYMSSLLQSLFHTRLFRACVYNTPVALEPPPPLAPLAGGLASAADGPDSDRPHAEAPSAASGVSASGAAELPPLPDVLRVAKKSRVVHALQRVFLALEGAGSRFAGVSTRPLTHSFGWHDGQELQQHDVQELMRILLDHLEKKMARTPLAKCIPNLFAGEITSRVIAPATEDRAAFHSEPTTTAFFDLQLPVQGHADVLSAMTEYVSDADLSGPNAYELPGSKAKVDAVKRTRFKVLPPVLHLHLMRFTYDPATDGKMKVNSRFEFPEVLDLSKFVDDDAPSYSQCDANADAGDSADLVMGPSVVAAPASKESSNSASLLVVDACARARRACESLSSHAVATSTADLGVASAPAASASSAAASRASAGVAAPAFKPVRYLLHSVLTHSGTVNSGHYYAYVRPGLGLDSCEGGPGTDKPCAPDAMPPAARLCGRGQDTITIPASRFPPGSALDDGVPCDHRTSLNRGGWFKFDDLSVSAVAASEAVDDNFGSGSSGGHGRSAYYLVYVREDALADVALAGCHPLLFAPGCELRGSGFTAEGGNVWAAADAPSVPRSGPLVAFPEIQTRVVRGVKPVGALSGDGSGDDLVCAAKALQSASPQHKTVASASLVAPVVDLTDGGDGLFAGDSIEENAAARKRRAKSSKFSEIAAIPEQRARSNSAESRASSSHSDGARSSEPLSLPVSPPVSLLVTPVPVPSEVVKRVEAALAYEQAEQRARTAFEKAARLKTFALFHVVTEAHQACSPVPQGNERDTVGSVGSSIDALPLSNAIRCSLRLSDTSAELYSAVQTTLGLQDGSFLLWAAKRRKESDGYVLRPALLWPGCPWLPPTDAAAPIESDLALAQRLESSGVMASCVRNVDEVVADEKLNVLTALRTADGPDMTRLVPECMDPAHPTSPALLSACESGQLSGASRWGAAGAWALQVLQPWQRYYSGVLGNGDVALSDVSAPSALDYTALWSTISSPQNLESSDNSWSSLPVSIEVVVFLQPLPRSSAYVLRPPSSGASLASSATASRKSAVTLNSAHSFFRATGPALARSALNCYAWYVQFVAAAISQRSLRNVIGQEHAGAWEGAAASWFSDPAVLSVNGGKVVAESLVPWPTSALEPSARRQLFEPTTPQCILDLFLQRLSAGGSRLEDCYEASDFVPVHVYRYCRVPSAPGEPVVAPDLQRLPCAPRIAVPHPHHGSPLAFIGTVIVPVDIAPADFRDLLRRWLGLLPPEHSALKALAESDDALKQNLWGGVLERGSSDREPFTFGMKEFMLDSGELTEPLAKGATLSGKLQSSGKSCFSSGDVMWVEYSDADVLRWMLVAQGVRHSRGREAWVPRPLCDEFASIDAFAMGLDPAAHTSFSLRGAMLDCPGLLRDDCADSATMPIDMDDVAAPVKTAFLLPTVIPASFSRFSVTPTAPDASDFSWLSRGWHDLASHIAWHLNSVCDQFAQAALVDGGFDDFMGNAPRLDPLDVLRAFATGVPARDGDTSVSVGSAGRVPPLFLPFDAAPQRTLSAGAVAAIVAAELNRRLRHVCAALLARRYRALSRSGDGASPKKSGWGAPVSEVISAFVSNAETMERDPSDLRLPSTCLVCASHLGLYTPILSPLPRERGRVRSWVLVKSTADLREATEDTRGALDPFSPRPPPRVTADRKRSFRPSSSEQWLFSPRHLAFDLLPLPASELEAAVALQCRWVGDMRRPAQTFVLNAGAHVPLSDLVGRVRAGAGLSEESGGGLDGSAACSLRFSLYSLVYGAQQRSAPAKVSPLASIFGQSVKHLKPDSTSQSPYCSAALISVLTPSTTLGAVASLAKELSQRGGQLARHHVRHGGPLVMSNSATAVVQIVLVAEPVVRGEPAFPDLLVTSDEGGGRDAGFLKDTDSAARRPQAHAAVSSLETLGARRSVPARAAKTVAAANKVVDISDTDDDQKKASDGPSDVDVDMMEPSTRRRRGKTPTPAGARPAQPLPPLGEHCVWIAVSLAVPRPAVPTAAAGGEGGPSIDGPRHPFLAGRTAIVFVNRADSLEVVIRKTAAALGIPQPAGRGGAAAAARALLSPETFGLLPGAPLPVNILAARMSELLRPWPDAEVLSEPPVQGSPDLASAGSGRGGATEKRKTQTLLDDFAFTEGDPVEGAGGSSKHQDTKPSRESKGAQAASLAEGDSMGSLGRIMLKSSAGQIGLTGARHSAAQLKSNLSAKRGTEGDVWDAVTADADSLSVLGNAASSASPAAPLPRRGASTPSVTYSGNAPGGGGAAQKRALGAAAADARAAADAEAKALAEATRASLESVEEDAALTRALRRSDSAAEVDRAGFPLLRSSYSAAGAATAAAMTSPGGGAVVDLVSDSDEDAVHEPRRRTAAASVASAKATSGAKGPAAAAACSDSPTHSASSASSAGRGRSKKQRARKSSGSGGRRRGGGKAGAAAAASAGEGEGGRQGGRALRATSAQQQQQEQQQQQQQQGRLVQRGEPPPVSLQRLIAELGCCCPTPSAGGGDSSNGGLASPPPPPPQAVRGGLAAVHVISDSDETETESPPAAAPAAAARSNRTLHWRLRVSAGVCPGRYDASPVQLAPVLLPLLLLNPQPLPPPASQGSLADEGVDADAADASSPAVGAGSKRSRSEAAPAAPAAAALSVPAFLSLSWKLADAITGGTALVRGGRLSAGGAPCLLPLPPAAGGGDAGAGEDAWGLEPRAAVVAAALRDAATALAAAEVLLEDDDDEPVCTSPARAAASAPPPAAAGGGARGGGLQTTLAFGSRPRPGGSASSRSGGGGGGIEIGSE